jgi:protocatechuate 3,4-dioxygenase beta subunit
VVGMQYTMQTFVKPNHVARRDFITNMALGASAFWMTSGAFAEALTLTPSQTEGPLYPDHLPLDTDNDLLRINESTTPAVGEITHLGGKILDHKGDPIRNAVVEIWQVDNQGVYIHSKTAGRPTRDKNFQGYGRFITSSSGEYYFRTIKPPSYGRRAQHIHFAIIRGNHKVLTTQLYVKGDPRIKKDGPLNRIQDPNLKNMLIKEFKPLKGSKAGELTVNFDLVVGVTPEDPKEDPARFRNPKYKKD